MGNVLISIIVPSFNEEDNVLILYDKIKEILSNSSFELIYVDDGSTDKTLRNLKRLSKKYSEVKYISFSRNFGHQAALRAGLQFAKGDAVISMDADLQHPPEILPMLIKRWQEGYDIVFTMRKNLSNIGYFKRKTSKLFYKCMNFLSDLNIAEGAADFRLLDKKVVEIINAQHESELFLRGYISWLGFQQVGIPYTPAKRFSGRSKYTFKKMVKLAIDGITQFSIKPLRLSMIIGVLFALGGILYGIYALASYFLNVHITSGWTSIIVVLLITSGTQLILLGVVGEYVGKIFMQAKQRPDYVIREASNELRIRSV